VSSDTNDGISTACGIRNIVDRYRYLIEMNGGRRTPSLLLGREVQAGEIALVDTTCLSIGEHAHVD
jgi:hypothetical protein